MNKDVRVFSPFSDKVLMLKTSVQLTCIRQLINTNIIFKLTYSYAFYCALLISIPCKVMAKM